MESPKAAARHLRLGLTAALIVGAVIRVVYLLQIRDNPFFLHPIADAAHFDRWAEQIAAGDLWGSGPFFRAPLYAYALALVYWLLGHDPLVVRGIQFIVGLVGVAGTAILARRLWNDRVGVIAGWLAALYPTAIYYEGELLSDFLLLSITPFLLLACLHAAAHRRAGAVALAGALTGIAAITRPTVLATVPVLLALLVHEPIRQRHWRTALGRTTLFLVTAALMIAPVTLRNVMVGHDRVWIAWQGGINFAVGNHRGADGVSAAMPPWGTAWTVAEITAAAETAAGHRLKPSEVSRYWTGRGWQFWRESPAAALRLLGRKLLLFWQDAEYSNNQSRSWFLSRWGPVLLVLPLSFGLLVGFGAIGWFSARSSLPHRLILLWTILYGIAVAAFFVSDRFRLPVVPIWIGAAAAGLSWLWDRFRRRHWRAAVPAAVIVPALVLVGRCDFFDLPTESLPRSYLALGNIQLESGQTSAALASYDTALAIDPGYPGLWMGRGAAHYRAGLVDSAAEDFRRELQRHPASPEALTNLAVARLDLADTATALLLLEQALAASPRFLPAAVSKARVLRSQNRREDAYQTLRRTTDPTSGPDAHLLLGVLSMELGRLEEADSLFATVVHAPGRIVGADVSPDVPRLLGVSDLHRDLALAHYNRGVIAGMRRVWRDATTELRSAVNLDPQLAQAWSNLAQACLQVGAVDSALVAAHQAVHLGPGNPVYLTTRAMAYLSAGDTAAAAADARAALDHDSNFAPAIAILRRISTDRQ
ncbi:MAG: tetratricopeptide repeat protein [Candidatus Zixiibacteriota bacterium]